MLPLTKPTLFRQCIAEFIGTAILIFFGVGAVAAPTAGLHFTKA